MATYIIRDEKGIAKAKITGNTASVVFHNVSGHFLEVNYKTGKKIVYEIDTDYVLNLEQDGMQLSFYLWKGDRLIPQN